MIQSTHLKTSTVLLLLAGTMTFTQTTDSSTDLVVARALIQTVRETVIGEDMHIKYVRKLEGNMCPHYGVIICSRRVHWHSRRRQQPNNWSKVGDMWPATFINNR